MCTKFSTNKWVQPYAVSYHIFSQYFFGNFSFISDLYLNQFIQSIFYTFESVDSFYLKFTNINQQIWFCIIYRLVNCHQQHDAFIHRLYPFRLIYDVMVILFTWIDLVSFVHNSISFIFVVVRLIIGCYSIWAIAKWKYPIGG